MYKYLCLLAVFLLAAEPTIAQESALENADGNSDGKVTVKELAEYAGTRLQGFDQLDAFAKKVDADGNGEISKEEFEGRMQVLRNMRSEAQEGTGTKKDDDGNKPNPETSSKAHVEGDKATDFELQSIGKKIKLSDNFGKDGKSVVVVFSRANW